MSSGSRFLNDITLDFRKRRAALEPSFPFAYEFLLDVERLHQEDARFHVGTAKNLHLYLDDRYLAYICIGTGPSISFRAKPNLHIKEGTHDDSHSLFGDGHMLRLVLSPERVAESWAEVLTDGTVEVTSRAPRAFFDAFLARVRMLARG